MTQKENSEEIVTIQTHHSDLVDVEVKTAPKCRVTLIVKAKEKIMYDAKQEAIKQVSKEVSIPGFRKGKAPLAILESKYPGAVAKAWDKTFVDIAFKEGQTLAKIPVLNNSSRISYQVHTLTDSHGEASFQFEREPEVPPIDYTKLSLKEGNPVDVSQENIEGTLKNIQMFYAKWQQVQDRPVKEDDFVVLDIDDIDQDPPVQAFSSARFEVREKKMADWMRNAVLGKNLNDTIETISSPDAHESEENKKQFQPKKVKIYIKAIEEAILPTIDDELAKKLGASDVATMQVQLKNLMTKQAHTNWQQALREALSDQMLEVIPFEIPASMLEKEANFRMTQLFKQPSFSKRWKDEMSEEEKETKKHDVTKQAEHAIRLFYICRSVLAENKVAVSEDDIAPNYQSILEMMFADPNLINYKSQSQEHKAIEFSKYMMAKAQDFIIEKIRTKGS